MCSLMTMSRNLQAALLLFALIFFAAVNGHAQASEAYFVFRVAPRPETFVFKLTDPARIQEARNILASGQQRIIAGTIIKQPVYYNAAWSFHYDPKTIHFADLTTEVCDSSIRNIENNLDAAYPQWCPWNTHLISEIAAPTRPSGNAIPTVSMTFPYADYTWSDQAGGSVTLVANADDPDGTISKVEFLSGGSKVGETTTTPYMFTLNHLVAGNYSVSAVATDNVGATRSSKSVAFTITPNPNGNPINDTAFFVTQHYRDFFNREPDTIGQQFWIRNIEDCGTDTICREVKRIETSAAFFLSIEFQQTGYLVHRFYKASFGRRPLFAEFIPDTRAIGNGVVVNSPGWQQQLENNKTAFADAWVNRSSFASVYNALDNTQYVDTLIGNTGAVFSPLDRAALINALDFNVKTRAQVLREIAENQAFYDSELNAAFVEMQYFGYLRRNPQDAPDNNLDGFNYWLNKLEQFGGDFRKAEMIKAFLASDEYRRRFGTP